MIIAVKTNSDKIDITDSDSSLQMIAYREFYTDDSDVNYIFVEVKDGNKLKLTIGVLEEGVDPEESENLQTLDYDWFVNTCKVSLTDEDEEDVEDTFWNIDTYNTCIEADLAKIYIRKSLPTSLLSPGL